MTQVMIVTGAVAHTCLGKALQQRRNIGMACNLKTKCFHVKHGKSVATNRKAPSDLHTGLTRLNTAMITMTAVVIVAKGMRTQGRLTTASDTAGSH